MMTIDPDIIRRKAVSAMLDCICMMSPAQSHFRDACREHDRLVQRRRAGEDIDENELIACGERVMAAAEAIEKQWAVLFDSRVDEEAS